MAFSCAVAGRPTPGSALRTACGSQVLKGVEWLPKRLLGAFPALCRSLWRGCNTGAVSQRKSPAVRPGFFIVEMTKTKVQEASAPTRCASRETLRDAVFL